MCSSDVFEEAPKTLWPKTEKSAAKEDLPKVWRAVVDEIRKSLLEGKSTCIKNVGTFAVSRWQIGKLTAHSSPAFLLSGRLAQKFGVRAERKFCPRSAPRMLTAASVQFACPGGLRAADACIGAVQRALERRIAAGSARLDFPRLGTLVVERGVASMRFHPDFLTDFQESQKRVARPPPPQMLLGEQPQEEHVTAAKPPQQPQSQVELRSCECPDRPQPPTIDTSAKLPSYEVDAKEVVTPPSRAPSVSEAKRSRTSSQQHLQLEVECKSIDIPKETRTAPTAHETRPAPSPKPPGTPSSKSCHSHLSERHSHASGGSCKSSKKKHPSVPQEATTQVMEALEIPPPPPAGADPRLCYVCQLKKMREDRAAAAPREPDEVTAAKDRVINLDVLRRSAAGVMEDMEKQDARRARNIEFAMFNKHVGDQRRMDIADETKARRQAKPMMDVFHRRPGTPRDKDANYYLEIKEIVEKRREAAQRNTDRQHKEDSEWLSNHIRSEEERRWSEARKRKAEKDENKKNFMQQMDEKRERERMVTPGTEKALPDIMGLPPDDVAFQDRRRNNQELHEFHRSQRDEKHGKDRQWREDRLDWEKRWLRKLKEEAGRERQRRAALYQRVQGNLLCTWRDQHDRKVARDLDERQFLARPPGLAIYDICPRCDRCFRRLGYPSPSIKM